MKRAFVFCSLLMAPAPAWARVDLPAGQEVTVKATVVAWGKQPPYSGDWAFYRRVVVAEYGVARRDLWALWLSDDSLPPVGAECRITYHLGRLRGDTVEPVNPWRDQALLDRFDCKS
ncbi:hypothetical protein [Asticcacaulis solisilvae]|uniref:hypothetical protein n=1 Tax=Asticcacaulis solisilvae TaxID=1217274 RepID=UPI003FD7D4F1